MLLNKVSRNLTSNPAVFRESGRHECYCYTNRLGNEARVAGLRTIVLKFNYHNYFTILQFTSLFYNYVSDVKV